ncbi:MAG: hypothetical protein ACRDN6_11170 [Gaiellaceae bacterium]
MGAWYTIGLFAGLGAAAGVLLAGILGAGRAGMLAAAALGLGAGVGLGLGFSDWPEAVGGGAGGALGALGASQIVRGTLRRGGTRGGTALIVGAGALGLAALAFVPVAGYLEALAVPGLAARLRRRAPETYAGLRTLARD